jgi:cell division protein ZapA (FtsZ GTPase activity inhibitor)
MHYRSPTYNLDTGEWSYTEFETRKEKVLYVDKQVKYPGEYNLKYTHGYWNEQGIIWQKTKSYPVHLKKSIDFRKHWDFEKEKCYIEGFVIYKKPSENLEFAVPGLMYWYLNYCPIEDKLKKKIDLPEIYDGDYHYFLYLLRCILRRKYGVVLKKRQSGYTLKNMAVLLNAIWFGDAAISKIFAYTESKVKDSWKLMENYRNHINKYCGWKRGFDPGTKLDWTIRRKLNDGSYVGNMSSAKGFTTKMDPTNGIGGNATVIFGEESGQNPTLDKSHEFVTSNVALGGLVTGLIIYSGAVGELDKAEPLKNFILKAKDNNFLTCPNNIEDDLEYGSEVGFFAPEWWNYVSGTDEDDEDNFGGEVKKYYDEWGNTDKIGAIAAIMFARETAKLKKPESYRFYCSQRPLSIREAFAIRKDSKFPLNLIEAQERRILAKEYSLQNVELERGEDGKITYKNSSKTPISDFPIDPAIVDKTGVVVMHEPPIADPQFTKTYYASIDPVGEGKTVSSESLCTIYVYKNDMEVTRIRDGEISTFIEQGKLVAWWCGRFDDINKTYERLLMIMELYNAWTLIENNITGFIQYCIFKRKQKYLVPRDQIIFLQELGANATVFQDYGWKNSGILFKKHLLDYGIESLKEELDHIVKENGDILKIIFGIERVTDIMLIKEMKEYHDGLNVDRLVAFCALMAFVKLQQANKGMLKRMEKTEISEPKTNPYKISKSAFRFMGNNQKRPGGSNRNPFKNLN